MMTDDEKKRLQLAGLYDPDQLYCNESDVPMVGDLSEFGTMSKSFIVLAIDERSGKLFDGTTHRDPTLCVLLSRHGVCNHAKD